MLVVWQKQLSLPANIPIYFVAVWHMAAEGQSDKMVSDMQVWRKRVELNPWKHCTRRHLLILAKSLCRPNTECTVRQWVHFSSGYSDMKDKPCSRRPCTAVTSQSEEHLNRLICANQRMTVTVLKKIGFHSWEFALLSSVVLLFVSTYCHFHVNK